MPTFELIDHFKDDCHGFDWYEYNSDPGEEFDSCGTWVINVMYDYRLNKWRVKPPYGKRIEVEFEVSTCTKHEVIPLWLDGVEEEQRLHTYQSWDDSHDYAVQALIPTYENQLPWRVMTIADINN